jgi:hypothetical protein
MRTLALISGGGIDPDIQEVTFDKETWRKYKNSGVSRSFVLCFSDKYMEHHYYNEIQW